MKLKDVAELATRWATPIGTQQDQDDYIYNGILIDIRVWVGTFNINLVVECADGRYFGSIRVPSREVYPWVLEFLRRNKGCRLREVIEKEIDIPETVR